MGDARFGLSGGGPNFGGVRKSGGLPLLFPFGIKGLRPPNDTLQLVVSSRLRFLKGAELPLGWTSHVYKAKWLLGCSSRVRRLADNPLYRDIVWPENRLHPPFPIRLIYADGIARVFFEVNSHILAL